MSNVMYNVFKTMYENFQNTLSKEFLVRNWLREDLASIDNFEITWPKADLVETVTAADGIQYIVINVTFAERSCRHHVERKIPIDIFTNPTKSNIAKLIIQFLEDDGMAFDVETKHDQFLRELRKRFEPIKTNVGETYEQVFLQWLDLVLENPLYKWDSSKKQYDGSGPSSETRIMCLSDSNLRAQDNPNKYVATNDK